MDRVFLKKTKLQRTSYKVATLPVNLEFDNLGKKNLKFEKFLKNLEF